MKILIVILIIFFFGYVSVDLSLIKYGGSRLYGNYDIGQNLEVALDPFDDNVIQRNSGELYISRGKELKDADNKSVYVGKIVGYVQIGKEVFVKILDDHNKELCLLIDKGSIFFCNEDMKRSHSKNVGWVIYDEYEKINYFLLIIKRVILISLTMLFLLFSRNMVLTFFRPR